MKAGSKKFNEAIAILCGHHSNKITINLIPTGKSNVSNQVGLVLHESCASVVNELVAAGFSLYPCPDGIHVEYIGA